MTAVAVRLLDVDFAPRGSPSVPARNLRIEPGLPFVTLHADSGSGTGMQYSLNDPTLVAKIVIGIAAVMLLLALVLSVLSWLRSRLRNVAGIAVPLDQADGQLGTLYIPMTVALVKDSPDTEPAERLLDYLLSTSVGKKLAEGVPAEIQANPAVQEAYLGSVE